MLYTFLTAHQDEILAATEKKTVELAGEHPTSAQLKQGLLIFYRQIIAIVHSAEKPASPPPMDVQKIATAADHGDEPTMAMAAGRPEEAELAKAAGQHGIELLNLGYKLSHVVHSYGAICQSVTEVASKRKAAISAGEFHAFNRCLDVAIAGAVTAYQSHRESGLQSQAEEMRRVLAITMTAFKSIRNGTVGAAGSTGQVVLSSLERLSELIDA